jgi:hypothetical protein
MSNILLSVLYCKRNVHSTSTHPLGKNPIENCSSIAGCHGYFCSYPNNGHTTILILAMRSNCQTKKLKSGYGPHWGSGTKTNRPTDSRSQCNLKLNLYYCTANYRPILSPERATHKKNKESNCHSNKCNIWSPAAKGARHKDELADWSSVVM